HLLDGHLIVHAAQRLAIRARDLPSDLRRELPVPRLPHARPCAAVEARPTDERGHAGARAIARAPPASHGTALVAEPSALCELAPVPLARGGARRPHPPR